MSTTFSQGSKKPTMPTKEFTSLGGVGQIKAMEECYSEGKWFGVSWASTDLGRFSSMEEAAAIAKAVAESGADNIYAMRAVVSQILAQSPSKAVSNEKEGE